MCKCRGINLYQILKKIQCYNKIRIQRTKRSALMSQQIHIETSGSSCQNSKEFFKEELQEDRPYRRWTIEENLKYINFIRSQWENFKDEKNRRSVRIFKKLAVFMKTKTQSQCKSHHQKMIKQYKTLENMIQKVLSRALKTGKTTEKTLDRIEKEDTLSYSESELQPEKNSKHSIAVKTSDIFDVLERFEGQEFSVCL